MTTEEKMAYRIKSKRKELGMTMEQLGDAVGVQKSAINKWEHGNVTNIKRSCIHTMSNLFNVSPAWLMGYDSESDKMPTFDSDHIELIKIYSSLTPEQKTNVMNMLRSFVPKD